MSADDQLDLFALFDVDEDVAIANLAETVREGPEAARTTQAKVARALEQEREDVNDEQAGEDLAQLASDQVDVVPGGLADQLQQEAAKKARAHGDRIRHEVVEGGTDVERPSGVNETATAARLKREPSARERAAAMATAHLPAAPSIGGGHVLCPEGGSAERILRDNPDLRLVRYLGGPLNHQVGTDPKHLLMRATTGIYYRERQLVDGLTRYLHLRRVDFPHAPADLDCPGCGQHKLIIVTQRPYCPGCSHLV